MRLYLLGADEPSYRQLTFPSYRAFSRWYHRFNGNPVKRYWTGKEKFRYEYRDLPKGDILYRVGGVIAFSSRAAKALFDLLEPNGELMRIRCEKDTVYFYNVTRVVDALDEHRSELEPWGRNRILAVYRHVFFEDRIAGDAIFKIPQFRLEQPYVTEPFVQRAKEAGLKGFTFELVYSTGEDRRPDCAEPPAILT